jgi:DNA-binding response OmpR family regulator
MNGYEQVHCISDSDVIQDYIDNHDVNLIILDFNLPHLNSIGIVKQVKKMKENASIPIVIQTTETDIETHKKLLKEGVKCVLTRSCSLSKFLRIIHNLLEINLYHKA